MKSGTAQLKERGPGRRPDGRMRDEPHRWSNFVNAVSWEQHIFPNSNKFLNHRKLHKTVGLQGWQIKTGLLSSTVQMMWAYLPKRLCNYRMHPKFIGIWQNVLLTALTELLKGMPLTITTTTRCNHIFTLEAEMIIRLYYTPQRDRAKI